MNTPTPTFTSDSSVKANAKPTCPLGWTDMGAFPAPSSVQVPLTQAAKQTGSPSAVGCHAEHLNHSAPRSSTHGTSFWTAMSLRASLLSGWS